jgi:HAMP domain-containing protein
MGMPVITPGEGSRDQAITDLIQSVALQEAALAHIMNAEGEKMQKIIGLDNVTSEELLALNKSVGSMINSITRLEMMLQAKLDLFSDELINK